MWSLEESSMVFQRSVIVVKNIIKFFHWWELAPLWHPASPLCDSDSLLAHFPATWKTYPFSFLGLLSPPLIYQLFGINMQQPLNDSVTIPNSLFQLDISFYYSKIISDSFTNLKIFALLFLPLWLLVTSQELSFKRILYVKYCE
jgi:hypothetical protein